MDIICFLIKIKTNYIRFIYHLKGGSMKSVTYTTSGVTIYFLKVFFCGSVVVYLDYITNLGILPYLLQFSEVLKRVLIIEYFVG